MPLRRTACSATAIGSVSAAVSTSRPLGTRKLSDASASIRSAYAPGACGDRPVGCTAPCALSKGNDTTAVPGCELLAHPVATLENLAAELVSQHRRGVTADGAVVADLLHEAVEIVGVDPRV